MKKKGVLSGFLLSKMATAIAVSLLIVSVSTVYSGAVDKNRELKYKEILDVVFSSLREARSLPGNARLDRKLPSLSEPYVLVFSGNMSNFQRLKVEVRGSETVSRSAIFSRRVNGGSFEMKSRSPRRIIIESSQKISVELV